MERLGPEQASKQDATQKVLIVFHDHYLPGELQALQGTQQRGPEGQVTKNEDMTPKPAVF